MFTDLFGGAPHARVLDYLAEEIGQDQTITNIARGADVARPTVYKVLDDFIEQDLVVQTRTVGNSRFFQLNREDPLVHDLLRVIEPEVAEDDEGFPDLDLSSPSTTEERRARRKRRKR